MQALETTVVTLLSYSGPLLVKPTSSPISAARESRKHELHSLFLTRKTKAARGVLVWVFREPEMRSLTPDLGQGRAQEVSQKSPDDSVRAGRG